jgi:hypothetical protein
MFDFMGLAAPLRISTGDSFVEGISTKTVFREGEALL